MYLGGEDLLAHYGDSKLEALGNIGLENHWAVLNRRRVADIAPRDYLAIAPASGGVSHSSVKSITSQFADDVALLLVIKVQELFPVVGDQGGRKFQPQFGRHSELRGLQLGAFNGRRVTGQPAARERVPQVLYEGLTIQLDELTSVGVLDLL